MRCAAGPSRCMSTCSSGAARRHRGHAVRRRGAGRRAGWHPPRLAGPEPGLHSRQLPVVLGRSPQATYCVDDTRVSRSHARIDWHGGTFQLTDLSYNGTYVASPTREIVSLRRGSCTLHGKGVIGLGGSPADPSSACVRFEVLRCGATAAQPPPEPAHRLRALRLLYVEDNRINAILFEEPAHARRHRNCRWPRTAPRRWRWRVHWLPRRAGARRAPARHDGYEPCCGRCARRPAWRTCRPSCARPTPWPTAAARHRGRLRRLLDQADRSAGRVMRDLAPLRRRPRALSRDRRPS